MTNIQEQTTITDRLILYFAQKTKGHIKKIQVVKFLYLADLYSVKWRGEPITDLDWKWYHYGPWEETIDERLRALDSAGLIRIEDSHGATMIRPGDNAEQDLDLPTSMQLMLRNILRRWSGYTKEDIDELLAYVYTTAPMVAVKSFGVVAEDRAPLNLFLEQEKLLMDLESEELSA